MAERGCSTKANPGFFDSGQFDLGQFDSDQLAQIVDFVCVCVCCVCVCVLFCVGPRFGCSAGAGPAPPPDRRRGFTRQPENSKRAHFRDLALQTPPKFDEKTPTRENKERKMWRQRGEKKRHFGPTLWASHPLGPHPPFG